MLDASQLELEKLIYVLEYLIGWAKFIALSFIWETIAFNLQQYGTVKHDISIAFTLQINGETEKALYILLLSKGTIKEMKAQIGGMPKLKDELWFRIAAILLKKTARANLNEFRRRNNGQ